MKYSIEYLITNEDSIDWDDYSSNNQLSSTEIRLFGKHIDWKKYILTHNCISTAEFEEASKFLTSDDYDYIAFFNMRTQEFIRNHAKNFDWNILIKFHYLTAETLAFCYQNWKDIDKEIFKKSKEFNIFEDQNYTEIILLLNI